MTGNGSDSPALAAFNEQVHLVLASLDMADAYDLHSEDLDSCRRWAELMVDYTKDVLALIEIVKGNEQELRLQLQDGVDHAQGLLDSFKDQTRDE